MSKKLFVGNLPWKVSEDELRDVFGQYGEIEDLIILKDKETGKAKGFGFVTYKESADADAAIEKLNNFELDGRNISVMEALPPKPRTPRY